MKLKPAWAAVSSKRMVLEVAAASSNSAGGTSSETPRSADRDFIPVARNSRQHIIVGLVEPENRCAKEAAAHSGLLPNRVNSSASRMVREVEAVFVCAFVELFVGGVGVRAEGARAGLRRAEPRRKTPRTAAGKLVGRHAPFGRFHSSVRPRLRAGVGVSCAPGRSSGTWALWEQQRTPEGDREISSFTADKLAHLRGI